MSIGRGHVKQESYLTFRQRFINLFIWALILLSFLFFIVGIFAHIFDWAWASWIYWIVIKVMKRREILETIATTIGAICLAILPVLLSVDSDSLLSKLGYQNLIFVIKEIVVVFSYAVFVAVLLLLHVYTFAYIVQLVFFFGTILLILTFLKTYLGLSIIILQCVQYRSRNLQKDKNNKKYIYSLIEKIYNKQNN